MLKEEIFKSEDFLNKLEESKKQYGKGKIHIARTVFSELREKYNCSK